MSYSAIARRTTEVFTPDALLLTTDGVRTKKRTLVSGQNLARGAVLGIITTGGRLTLSASAASDGSQTPRYILAESCNASAADAECVVYETGSFNGAAMILGAGHTLASIEQGLRSNGIFFQTIQTGA
jgi:hypothetical protein